MVIQFLGHRNDGCLDWFDVTEPTCTTPTPLCDCPIGCDGSSVGTPCGINFWVRMNWSGIFCPNYSPPNGLIGGPLDLYFQPGVFGSSGSWVYSTPTAAGQIYCSGGQWIFEYSNTSIDGSWSVSGVLGNVCDMTDPCNIIGLSSVGTITYNVILGNDPNDVCAGEEPINLSVIVFECPL